MSISDKGEFILSENNEQDNDKNKFTSSSSSTYSCFCSLQRLRGVNTVFIICILCLLYFLMVSILFSLDSMENIEYESVHSMKGIINNNYKTRHLQMFGVGQDLFGTKWNLFITTITTSEMESQGPVSKSAKGNSFILTQDKENPAIATFALFTDEKPSRSQPTFQVDFSKEQPSEIIADSERSTSFTFPIVGSTTDYEQIYKLEGGPKGHKKTFPQFYKLFCKEFKKHQQKPTKEAKGDEKEDGKGINRIIQKASDWNQNRLELKAKQKDAVSISHKDGFQHFGINEDEIPNSAI